MSQVGDSCFHPLKFRSGDFIPSFRECSSISCKSVGLILLHASDFLLNETSFLLHGIGVLQHEEVKVRTPAVKVVYHRFNSAFWKERGSGCRGRMRMKMNENWAADEKGFIPFPDTACGFCT